MATSTDEKLDLFEGPLSLTVVNPFLEEMIGTANKIATRGRGILAADESTGTIGKRFSQIDVENNEENRRKYRELLFTSEGIEEYISGVIMFEETLYQKTKDNKLFVEILNKKGIVPGIKVDKVKFNYLIYSILQYFYPSNIHPPLLFVRNHIL